MNVANLVVAVLTFDTRHDTPDRAVCRSHALRRVINESKYYALSTIVVVEVVVEVEVVVVVGHNLSSADSGGRGMYVCRRFRISVSIYQARKPGKLPV